MSKERATFQEVIHVELEELRRRRRMAGDGRPLPPLQSGADGEMAAKPDATHDLVGLTFSGGGIRSASFSLGVVQHMISSQSFRLVDYLSTVSGGGYIGSCLSALMHSGPHAEKLLVERSGSDDPLALKHLRNRSNYLLAPGPLGKLRLPAIFLVGTLYSVLMFLPPVVALVFLTELFFELTGQRLPDTAYLLPIFGVAPLLGTILIRPIQASRAARGWSQRDASDGKLAWYVVLAVASLLAVPLLWGLEQVVNMNAQTILAVAGQYLADEFERGFSSRLVWAAALAIGLFVVAFVRMRSRLLLLLAGGLGPVALLAFYVLVCAEAINSPVGKLLDGKLAFQSQDTVDENALRKVLKEKHISESEYEFKGCNKPICSFERVGIAAPRWKSFLSTEYTPRLTVRILDNGLVQIEELRLLRGHAEWWLYLSAVVVWLYNFFFVNVNRISLHGFYRDRLSRTFLMTQQDGGLLGSADELKLSELGGATSAAPYHLINTALNLQGSDNPDLRERKTAPFFLAKRYSGSDYTGYNETSYLERCDPHLNLGSAMAISAAAAAPNMGVVTLKPLAFVMTLLNIRLNYWLPNPDSTKNGSWLRRLRPTPGLLYLLAEALGNPSANSRFVNCSDGGHIENLAVYELIRRRCHTIVCVDGEADPHFRFKGLTTLQRYAEIDFGARIDIELDKIRPGADGRSASHYAVGEIRYDDGMVGTFIYIKLSCTGAEPDYLDFYRDENEAFPHESTADQFFDETQFEVYRALGRYAAEEAFDDKIVADCLSLDHLSKEPPASDQPTNRAYS